MYCLCELHNTHNASSFPLGAEQTISIKNSLSTMKSWKLLISVQITLKSCSNYITLHKQGQILAGDNSSSNGGGDGLQLWHESPKQVEG